MKKKLALMVSGSYCQLQELESVVAALSDWPLQLVYDSDWLCHWHSANERADNWLEMLARTDIDYCWCLRGGEGTADMLPFLHENASKMQAMAKKRVVGMSDVTPLLLYLTQQYQWPCVHFVNALSYALPGRVDDYTKKQAKALFVDDRLDARLSDLVALNDAAKHDIFVRAPLCVGNLSMMNISIQDLYEFESSGRIVMLEDWHERGYVVERTLKYFKRIGKFNDAAALVFGDFAYDMPDAGERAYLQKVLQRFASSLDIPCFQADFFGHGQRHKALEFNKIYEL